MEIRELIRRMTSGDFARARAEAKELSDLAALEQVKAVLEPAKGVAEKLYCYWILGDLGQNTGAPEVVDYLLERAGTEKTVRFRKEALVQAAFLNGATAVEPVLSAVSDRSRDIRYAAITALGACRDPRCEEALIRLVESDEDFVATRHAAVALNRIGTERCVEPLAAAIQRLPRDRWNEVTVAAALLAISRIDGAAALQLAVEDLNTTRSEFVNWASMLVIRKHGGAEHVDAVVDRLQSILAKKNRPSMTYSINFVETEYGDEFSAGVSFLLQFSDAKVSGFLEGLAGDPDSLFDFEAEFLAGVTAG